MGFTREQMSKGGKRGKRGASKMTVEMRTKFREAIESVDLIADLKAVEPAERLRIVAMLSKYVIPALATVEVDMTDITVKQFIQMTDQEREQYINTLMN